MPDAPEVTETLEKIAGHIAQIAAPLAKTIDAVAFGGHPPRVVTFLAIDEAIHRGLRPGPNREEMIENIEYADSLLFPRGVPDDIDIGSFRLIDGVAQVIRKVVKRVTADASAAEEADALSRALAYQVVFAAWLVREQLLVVDLALALGIDPTRCPLCWVAAATRDRLRSTCRFFLAWQVDCHCAIGLGEYHVGQSPELDRLLRSRGSARRARGRWRRVLLVEQRGHVGERRRARRAVGEEVVRDAARLEREQGRALGAVDGGVDAQRLQLAEQLAIEAPTGRRLGDAIERGLS